MNQITLTQFLAHYRKSDSKEQSVKKHLEEVLTAAGSFVGKIGLTSIGKLIGLLHDLGEEVELNAADMSPPARGRGLLRGSPEPLALRGHV